MKYLKLFHLFETIQIEYATGEKIKSEILPWDVSEIIKVDVPTDIDGKPVLYRGASEKEVADILNGGNSGTFWRDEPHQYRNYGEYLLITAIKPGMYGNDSKGDVEAYDGKNYVGYTFNKNDKIIILDKKTSKIIYKN